LEGRTTPTTFTVVNTFNMGAGSLRSAVLAANFTSGLDTIIFDPSVTGTITLTSGDIDITEDLAIAGPGLAVLKVSGNLASRIFDLSGAPAGANITIAGLTLSDGKVAALGGAIYANGQDLTLSACALVGNSTLSPISAHSGGAVAIENGTFTATDCTFINNSTGLIGGGVFASQAKSVIERCRFSGNTGGGISTSGELLLEDSTVSGNAGSGVRFYGDDPLTIRNSTISGNATGGSGGGIFLFFPDGPIVIQNSTVTANQAGAKGGGIARNGGTSTLVLESSVLSGNTNGDATSPDAYTSGTLSAKFSAVGSKVGVSTFTPDATSNALLGADLKLGPLASNGGPTPTHLPAANSPLVNKGSNPAGEPYDQRGPGFGRSRSGGVDVGAVEALTPFVVLNDADSGFGSLRQAAIDANAFSGADVITFDPNFFATPRTITLTTGQIMVGESVQVLGPDADLVTVSGGKTSRIIDISPAPAGAVIGIRGLTVTAGKVTGFGGAIRGADENLTLTACVFTGNVASPAASGGGAVAMTAGGDLTAVDCRFLSNSASNIGGAIEVFGAGAALVLRRCTLSGNSAHAAGGAYVAGTLLLESCTVSGNTAVGSGGGLMVSNYYGPGTFTVRNSTISGNSAGVNGGGIALADATNALTVQNCTVTANTASGKGGGIARNSGSAIIALESSIVSKNSNAAAPDVYTTGVVQAKTSALFSMAGIAAFSNLGGNLAAGTDPLMGPLANNGGPTQTHLLSASSPCIDKGSNPTSLAYDQRGLAREFPAGKPDIGALELQPVIPPTAVVKVNDGSAQRSMVRSLTVTFSQAVVLPCNPATAFKLERTGPGGPIGGVSLNVFVNVVGESVILTFHDPIFGQGSLIDGRYTLTALGAQVEGGGGLLDGNGDGTAGDDLVFSTHRLFGDGDGDGDVDAIDFGAFRAAFGVVGSLSAFDADGDQDVDAVDFGQFRQRFGSAV